MPILGPVSLDRELAWAAAIFQSKAQILSRFIKLKGQFQAALLVGSFDECEKTLDVIEQELGFSIWLLENRIALRQFSRGLEVQKAYFSRVREMRPERDLLSFLGFFVSWRNEETSNPFQFKKNISDKAAEWKIEAAFRSYLLYKLAHESSYSEEAIADILRYEASYSIVDYYDSFVLLAAKSLTDGTGSHSASFSGPLRAVVNKIEDLRLVKLCFLLEGQRSKDLERCVTRAIGSDKALIAGDRSLFERTLPTDLAASPSDIRLWLNTVIGQLDLGYEPGYGPGLGARFSKLFKFVIEKDKGYEEAILEAARFVLNFCYLPCTAQFEAFFLPELSNSPRPKPETQLVSFALSDYLDPATLRFIGEDRKPDFVEALLKEYGSHPVVEFERWRADADVAPTSRPEGIANPLLTKEVLIEHLSNTNNYDEALALAREMEAEAGPRHRRIAQRWIANCLLSSKEMAKAIDYVCRTSLSDLAAIPIMPLSECAIALDKKQRALLAGELSPSIVLDIFDRKFESKYKSERNYAYEDFLTVHGMQRPSQLRDKIDQFERSQIIYYLKFLCVPEVMQASAAFSSSRELEDERLAVCAILAEIDPEHLEEYELEIRDITRKLIVKRGVREIEQSKIYVDMAAIRRWADKSLRESFVRYQALLSAGLDAGKAGLEEAIRELIAGGTVSEAYLQLPKNELSGLLVNMLNDFFDQCLKDPAHGLDSYLSMRIRHGALAGQLRAPLEQEAIISQREGPLEAYKSNEFWIAQYEYLPPEITNGVDKRLGEFSKKFDDLVDRVANEYLQIHSTEKQKGLFRLPVTVLMVRALASGLSDKLTFEDFINTCIELFWQLLEPCLNKVRQTVEHKVQPEMSQLFEALRTDLKRVSGTATLTQLDAAILNAKTKAQQALEQVKDWFRVATPLTERDFSFEEIVEISVECVRNIHPEFDPKLNIVVPPDLFRVNQLTLFSDIFFIIFDNVRKHSGLRAPDVKISANVENARLDIEVENHVAHNVISESQQTRVAEIRKAIAKGEGEYLRAVRSEGGTGLKKLRNILRGESSSAGKLIFGFNEDRFFVRLDLAILGIYKAFGEKGRNA